MCGIAGVASSSKEKNYWVESAVSTISHRGPDESGFFNSPEFSCGMCRLSIIDVAHGHQPNFNSNQSVVSVFNGEIYNFVELRSILVKKGYPVNALGDSALIPYLYEEYGTNFPAKLQGMFAIALFDRNQHSLHLIRDRLGKKPIWYYKDDESLAFCSEVKGLLQLGVPKSLEISSIAEYLQFGYINAPSSAFEKVFQVKPGTILTLSQEGVEEREYWSPLSVGTIAIDLHEAKLEATRLLREAVKSRLLSERPLGAFLSGGIDSTIICALMQEESMQSIHTFSIGFKNKRFDESQFARKVASHLGTIHHEKIVCPDSSLITNSIVEVLDQPFADSSIIPTFMLSDFAREQVVVALSGDGGDEVFGGYLRYRAGKYLDLLNPLLRLNPFSLLPTNPFKSARLNKLLKHSKHQELSRRYLGFQSLFQIQDLFKYLSPELFNLNGVARFENNWGLTHSQDATRIMQEIDLLSYLPGDLMYKVDMSSMANSLEVRSPFLDYRVVEFGLSLPSALKVKLGSNKFLLKEIAKGFVPRETIDRPKMGFGIPRAQWLREDLKPLAHDTLLSHRSLQRGWYKPNAAKELLHRHHKGENLDHLIWPMVMLELWAVRWLD